MEDAEQNLYVAKLKNEFDSCDITGTGHLDKEELTALCRRLHLQSHLPLLLDSLLGPHHLGRVNFEEFKEGFVAVLSHSLNLSTSEEETSYLDPVVPEEVKPKFVKGTKRYGRRSKPDKPDSELTVTSEEAPPIRRDQPTSPHAVVQRPSLSRSTSLESVESIKSDDQTVSNKEQIVQIFEAQGQLKHWKQTNAGCPQDVPTPLTDEVEGEKRVVWGHLGAGSSTVLDRQKLSKGIGLKDWDIEAPVRKLEEDEDDRVSLKEFQRDLFTHGGLPKPPSCSTPIPTHHQHVQTQQALKDTSLQSSLAPLLTRTMGHVLLSHLDDGSGCVNPERVITVWNEEGVRNGREILQTLDFSLDEAVNLAELTVALNNEMLVSRNSIHHAALVSYQSETQFLQVQAEQAIMERDKAKADLDRAEWRNLQLVREVDHHHATLETLNETKIKSLEQEYNDRLASLRGQMEKESEGLLQQVERERTRFQEEVDVLRAQEASLQEEVATAAQENSQMETEMVFLKGRLLESENTIIKLQKKLDYLLKEKFGSLDGSHISMLGQEERFADIIREYEQQCRKVKELRDKNDELNSELEMLKNQGSGRKAQQALDSTPAYTWSSCRALTTESDSDDPEKTGTSLLSRKKMESDLANMSIETELAMEQLKERHQQEVLDLKIELNTKVNFYERSMELMRLNMEVERKDISQSFKMEISELEERVAELVAQLQSATCGPEREQRAQREQVELGQNYAREISNLVQKLTSEKDQLEAELRMKMDQEVFLVRPEDRGRLTKEQKDWKACRSEQATLERTQQKEVHERQVQGLMVALQEEQAQLDGCITSILSLEDSAQHLTTEAELELRNGRESIFICKQTQLAPEMRSTQAKCETLQKVMVQGNCAGSSTQSAQQQEQLWAKEEELKMVRAQLDGEVEELRNLEAFLQNLQEDNVKLVEKLRNRSVRMEELQLWVSSQKEALMSAMQLAPYHQDAYKQEGELVNCLSEETRAKLSKLWGDMEDLHFSLKQKGDMVLTFPYQLDSEDNEKARLENELRKMELQLEHQEELYEELKRMVELLTVQLKDKEEELCAIRERLESSPHHLQEALLESQTQALMMEEQFEREKNKMREQLLEMERLVMAVELAMDQTDPNREQLHEVTAENAVVNKRHSMMQQDIQRLEEVVNRKKEKLEQMEKEHEQNRKEVEKLYKENAKHWKEVLDLSSRNLQLSEENAELSTRLQEEQNNTQILRQHTEDLSREREEEAAMAQQLREELQGARDKLQQLSFVQTDLAGVMLKQQYLEQEKQRLQEEVEDKTLRIAQLQESLHSLATQTEQLHSELQAVILDRALQAQELASHQMMLKQAREKVQELEATVEKLHNEKEQLHTTQRQEAQALRRECQSLESQNQEMLEKVGQLQLHDAEFQRVTQESLSLKAKQAQLENDLLQLKDQCLHADIALAQAQSRHACELQQLRESVSLDTQEELAQLRTRLSEEEQHRRQLEAQLNQQAQQASTQAMLQQEQYEKVKRQMEEMIEGAEVKLKNVRILLQEKVSQLKEQLCRSTKSDLLLKELYVENAQLVKALQVTEQRQKGAERKNYLLEEKIAALNVLLQKMAPAALSMSPP